MWGYEQLEDPEESFNLIRIQKHMASINMQKHHKFHET